MSTIFNKRFGNDPNETRLTYKYTGQAHILQACLDYIGTPSPLTCTVDGNNVKMVAQKTKVRDIIAAYDNGETEHFACIKSFTKLFKDTVSRCKQGDIMFVQYSGHGASIPNEDGQESQDQAFCFRTQKGDDQLFRDDQVAKMIGQSLPNWLPCVFFVDACHSGSILDLTRKDIYKGKTVILFSGCQDNQYSQDTGNGGVMTNALLSVLATPECIEKRKKRNCSLQYIFNKMVEYNTGNPLPPASNQNKQGKKVNGRPNLQHQQEQEVFEQQIFPEGEQQYVQVVQGEQQYIQGQEEQFLGEEGQQLGEDPYDHLVYYNGHYYNGDQIVDYEGVEFNEFDQFWGEDEFVYEYGQDVQFYDENEIQFQPVQQQKPATDAQYFNLSWSEATDPTTICFPF